MTSKRQLARERARTTQSAILLVVGAGLMLIAVAAFLAIPQAAENVQNGSGISSAPAQINFAMPAIALTDLQGNPVSFEDYRGQVILYNAWATWCPPCKEEMPTLQAYYEAHKDQGFVVIAIEDGQPIEEVRTFVKNYGLTFPVWPDLEWAATKTLKINSLPTSILIDRNGVARYMWSGALDRATLEKYVTPLLQEN